VVDLVTEDEEQAHERFFVGWATLNPKRAAALLRELEAALIHQGPALPLNLAGSSHPFRQRLPGLRTIC